MVFQTKSKTKISEHFSEPSKQTSLPYRRNATTVPLFLCDCDDESISQFRALMVSVEGM